MVDMLALPKQGLPWAHTDACVCVCVQAGSVLLDSATPWTVACQAPLAMEFTRQEYWTGLSFPTSGDLLDPGIEPTSLAPPVLVGGFFTTVPTY